MRLKMLKEDIVRSNALKHGSGYYEPATCCPIAQCLKRNRIPFTRISAQAIIMATVVMDEVELPDVARNFIRWYDSGRNMADEKEKDETMEPIEFDVNLEPYVKGA